MGYRLAMSGEIRDWLAELCGSDPLAARKAGQALAALMTEGAGLAEPAVIAVPVPQPTDPVEALDHSYQLRLEQLNALRRRVTEAATARRRTELQLGELAGLTARLTQQQQRAVRDGRPELAEAREQVAGLDRLLPRISATEAEFRGEQVLLAARRPE